MLETIVKNGPLKNRGCTFSLKFGEGICVIAGDALTPLSFMTAIKWILASVICS